MSLESGHQETYVYGAESVILRPRQMLAEMWRDIVASRQLAVILAVRDLRSQYRQSFLGLFWILAPPIVLAVGFTVAQKNGIVNFGTSSIPQGAYILIGMCVWQIFAASIISPLQVMASYRSVLTKVVVPPEAIVLSSLIKLSITIALQILLITFAILWFHLPFTVTTLLGIPAVISVAIFGTAIGLLLMPVGLLYRDIALAIPIMEKAWLAITPIVFTNKLAPGGYYAFVAWLNPMTYLVVTTRQLVSGEHLTVLPHFFGVVALTVVLISIGLVLVRTAMPLVIERWSA